MKSLHLFFLLFFLSLNSFATMINKVEDIDNNKKVVQVGMFIQNDSLKYVTKKFKNNYDLFIKKYQNYQIVYIVNLNKSNINTKLKDIQKDFSDAFINNKVYFKASNKTKNNIVNKELKENSIRLGVFNKIEELNYILKLFSKQYAVLINPFNNMYEVYIKNIKQHELKSLFTITKYKFPQAQLIEKKEYVETKKDINVDKLISSYESLPYLIYGRLQ